MRKDTHVIYVHRGSSFHSSLKELKLILEDKYNEDLCTLESLAMISKRAVEKLKKRGHDAHSLDEVLFNCSSQNVIIAPLYLFKGVEFETLTNEHLKYYIREDLKVSEPLISDEYDLSLLSDILFEYAHDKNVLFIGHGSTSEANRYYQLIEESLSKTCTDNQVFVRTLDDDPKEFSLLLNKEGIDSITIIPLMFTAGYHASKDIFGEDSWKSEIEKSGIAVESINQGLLSNKNIRNLIHKKVRRLLEV